MSIKRTSEAEWKGSISDGSGEIKLGSGAFEGKYSFNSRFGDDTKATNPEELIAAAHAGCFSMAFSLILGKSGFTPDKIETKATVHIEKQGEGFAIPKIELVTEAKIPNISEDEFQQIAKAAKENCPVSKVLAAAEITLDATLKKAEAAG
ncbi:MAG: OsmC subfamily peroxiredoxin [Acidobacteria bacterium OLB17]|nr:MAG: OsmC subfamily peroxiredoxin [Acidobacteria bacterium OLB17]MCZ2390723.1 OsmC family protein [Acidobacteriota bacterium]